MDQRLTIDEAGQQATPSAGTATDAGRNAQVAEGSSFRSAESHSAEQPRADSLNSSARLLDVVVCSHEGTAPLGSWQRPVDKVVQSIALQRAKDMSPPRLVVLLATPDWCKPQRPLSKMIRTELARLFPAGPTPALVGGSTPGIFVSKREKGQRSSRHIRQGFVAIAIFSNDLWAAVDRVVTPCRLTRDERRKEFRQMAARLMQSRRSHLGLGTGAVVSLFGVLPGPYVDQDERRFLDLQLHDELLEAFGDTFSLFGGSAANDLKRSTSGFQFAQDECLESGLAVAFMEHDFRTGAIMSHGFVPTGVQVSVDALAGAGDEPNPVVIELDGKPAGERLKEIMAVQGLPGPRPVLGLEGGPNPHIVLPLEPPKAWDGGVRLNRRVHRGHRLDVLRAVNDQMVTHARDTFNRAIAQCDVPPEDIRVVLSFACIGRFLNAEKERPGRWLEAFESLTANMVGDAPVVCALCAGEYGEDDRRRRRADNFSLWIACLTGYPNSRAQNRLLQSRLLEAADELLRHPKSADVMREAVQCAMRVGAVGGQLCVYDPHLKRILGGAHGYAESQPGALQDFALAITHTWRQLTDSARAYLLPPTLRSWSLQIGRAPRGDAVSPRNDTDILTIVCANRLAVFVPDSTNREFFCDQGLVRKARIEAQFIMPLIGAHGLLATFQVGFPKGHMMDREQMALWLGFGQKVATALERAFEYEEREAMITIGSRADEIMRREPPREPIAEQDIEEFLGVLAEAVKADYAHMRLLETDSSGPRYRLIAAPGDLATVHRAARPYIRASEGSMRHGQERKDVFTITQQESRTLNGRERGSRNRKSAALRRAMAHIRTHANVPVGQPDTTGRLVFHSKHDYFFTQRRRRLIKHGAAKLDSLIAKRRADYAEAKTKEREQALARIGFFGAKTVHDLMRPLGVIQKLAELMSGPGAEARDEDVHSITQQVQNMMRLLKDRARGIDLGEMATSIDSLLHDARREMSVPWAGHPAYVGLSPDTVVRGNFWLRVALTSLLDNAHEACLQARHAELEVRVAHSSAASDKIDVVIENGGEKLTDTDVERILWPAHTTKPHHLGLGVPLAAAGIKTVGGTLTLAPRPNGGLTAKIELLLHECELRRTEDGSISRADHGRRQRVDTRHEQTPEARPTRPHRGARPRAGDRYR